MKICCKCEIEKEDSEFYKYKRNKDGLHSHCKKCIAETTTKWQTNNRSKVVASCKKWSSVNRDKCRERDKRYRDKNPLKCKARLAVHYAIKTGKLIRSGICENCSDSSTTQAHHIDYTKPLEVNWLCGKCHNTIHREVEACIQ